jgi:hypothetical protein
MNDEDEKRRTAPRTADQAEGERQGDEQGPIAPRTPGQAEGERDKPEDEGQS